MLHSAIHQYRTSQSFQLGQFVLRADAAKCVMAPTTNPWQLEGTQGEPGLS